MIPWYWLLVALCVGAALGVFALALFVVGKGK